MSSSALPAPLAGVPYWRLSSFYLCYFATLGMLLPYLPLFLHERGMTVLQIGLLAAIMSGMKIFMPGLWGWVADNYLNRTVLIRVVSAAGVLSFCMLLRVEGFYGYALVLLLFSLFWHAPIPQVEAVTLRQLGADRPGYSRIRLWGSVGFLISVTGMGYCFEVGGLRLLLPAIILALTLMLFSSFWLPLAVGVTGTRRSDASLLQTLRQPAVLALLGCVFLMQFSHAPYYTYYSVYLEYHGYARPLIGKLWAVGILCEIGVYMVMHRLVVRVGLRRIFIASMLVAVLRWQLIAWCTALLPVLFIAQTLHAITFGTFHAAAVLLVHRHFPESQHGRGQALYSSASFGAGVSLGSLLAGYVWGRLDPESMYHISALVALIGCWLAGWRVRDVAA